MCGRMEIITRAGVPIVGKEFLVSFQLPVEGHPEIQKIELRSFRDFYAFEQHVSTCRSRRGLEMVPQWYDQPVFYFSNSDSLITDGDEVYPPKGSNELDFELELAIVIGKEGRDIQPQDAWDHVLGFTILNDFSARDLQRQEMAVGLGPAKGKDFATSVGPKIIAKEMLQNSINQRDQVSLQMTATVDGRKLSEGNASTMHFSWPQIIAHASADATLRPGDLLGSGTVGTGCILELGPENTDGWLKPGNEIVLEIEKIGRLTNRIVPRP